MARLGAALPRAGRSPLTSRSIAGPTKSSGSSTGSPHRSSRTSAMKTGSRAANCRVCFRFSMAWAEVCRTTRRAERNGAARPDKAARRDAATVRVTTRTAVEPGAARSQASQCGQRSHARRRSQAARTRSAEPGNTHLWTPQRLDRGRHLTKLDLAVMPVTRPPNRQSRWPVSRVGRRSVCQYGQA